MSASGGGGRGALSAGSVDCILERPSHYLHTVATTIDQHEMHKYHMRYQSAERGSM